MFEIEGLDQYPELIAFLDADNEAERREYLPLLKKEYDLELICDDGNEDEAVLNPLQITAALGKLEHLNTLLGSHHFKESELNAEDSPALLLAAGNGYLDVVNRLLEFDVVRAEVAAGDNEALRYSAEGGHLEVVNCLLEFDAVRAEVATMYNEALRFSAGAGHLAVVNRLLEFDAVRAQVAAVGNEALCLAVREGHLEVVNRLLEFDEVRAEVAAGENGALMDAAENGHLEIVNRLLEFDAVRAQVSVRNNLIFCRVRNLQHLDLIKVLLAFPKVFAYAEMHEEECGQYTHPYLEERLNTLRAQRHLQETTHPEVLFDLNNLEEVKLLFYIARNLIRRNNPALLDDLRFLLEIPALKNIAHRSVTPGQSNELIRLALTIGNQGAAEILLNIPAVRELTIARHYYQDEMQGRLDLRELAQDQESSMHTLSTKEQERLSSAIERYDPLIEKTGVEYLFQALREMLASRYAANPAILSVEGKALMLPTSWQAFQQLNLPQPLYEEALKAYYKNKDHTALRYLSKPNFWMHPKASYVYVNPNNRNERYSSFEGYIPLILMFWLAATDPKVAPTQGHSLEGRLNHFIDELALIGRAHNYKSRIKTKPNPNSALAQQNPLEQLSLVLDDELEEYDDLEGDRPSCYSGVKRRLFQSVIGHPLLQMLTIDLVKQELQDFVRNHFKNIIFQDKQGSLKQAYESYIDTLEITPALQQSNIPSEAQNDFMSSLQEKYGQQFIQDPSFSKYIQKRFQLKINQQGELNDAHILNFAFEAGIEQLFLSKNIKKPGQLEFFNHAGSKQDQYSMEEDKAIVIPPNKPVHL